MITKVKLLKPARVDGRTHGKNSVVPIDGETAQRFVDAGLAEYAKDAEEILVPPAPEDIPDDEIPETEDTEDPDNTPEDTEDPDNTPEDGGEPDKTPEDGGEPDKTPEDGGEPDKTPERKASEKKPKKG
jgi:hypothetical protein